MSRCECFRRWRRCLLIIVLILLGHVGEAQHLTYPTVPTVTEYDVDPSWPERPDHVASWGAVPGLAIDAHGHVWVFNRGEDPVQVYASAGEFIRTWGRGEFAHPHQIRIDSDGYVWLVDAGLHTVQKFTPEGEVVLTLGVRGEKGTQLTQFNRPTDVAFAPSGDIFVSDGYGNRRIVHFDKDGTAIKTWGTYGTEPGQFVLPHSIVSDSKGRLYVADRNCGRIQVFDTEGKFLDQWANILMPWGLAITSDDEIWACGSSPHRWRREGRYRNIRDQLLMRFDSEGRVKQLWSLPVGELGDVGAGEILWVHCLVQDRDGNLYLGDIKGERAQKFVAIKPPPEETVKKE